MSAIERATIKARISLVSEQEGAVYLRNLGLSFSQAYFMLFNRYPRK